MALMTQQFHQCNVLPHSLHHSGGSVGRPTIILNFEMIELMRTSGYTWTEVANALETSRTLFGED